MIRCRLKAAQLLTLVSCFATRAASGQDSMPASQPSQPSSRPSSLPGQSSAAADPRPWTKRLTPAQEAAALRHYREGNRLFADEQYAAALAKYRKAIQHWDHPAIHYNMVECLVNLGRSLQAHQHLKAALRYGVAPLGERLHRQAKTYQAMFDSSLARIKIVCREAGAKVSLDGEPLFTGPGERTRFIVPGAHAVVASKRGFLPMAQRANVPPGKLTTIAVRLLPDAPVTLERRWKRRWLPWTVLGAGAAVAVAALPLYLLARADFSTVEQRFDELCSGREPQGGCVPAALDQNDRTTWNEIADLEGSAESKRDAAIGLLSVGAAIAIGGLVLVLLNQPRGVKRSSSEHASRIQVAPAISHDRAELRALVRF